MNTFDNDNYNKKIDNELKKKELENKYEAKFNLNSNLSPEIENEWLKSIEKFEKQFNHHKTITVWEYLGKPAFKKRYELKTEEITVELKRLNEIMNKSYIQLDTLCEVDDSDLYRFIAEELFIYKIENIHIEGMYTIFTYEDFHPNAEYDIQQSYDHFFQSTLSKMKNISGTGYDLLYIDTDNYKDIEGGKLKKEKVLNRINQFLNSFDYFEIISNEIDEININKEKTDARLNCNIHYKGCFNTNQETISYKGEGIFRLKPSEYGGWDIYHIDMPGLHI